MLEDVGDYNQKFMAQTPEEAGQRFSAGLSPRLPSDANDALKSTAYISPFVSTFVLCLRLAGILN